VFANALQDLSLLQPALIIGLISHFTGIALQEDIAETSRKFIELGNDILKAPSHPSP